MVEKAFFDVYERFSNEPRRSRCLFDVRVINIDMPTLTKITLWVTEPFRDLCIYIYEILSFFVSFLKRLGRGPKGRARKYGRKSHPYARAFGPRPNLFQKTKNTRSLLYIYAKNKNKKFWHTDHKMSL